MKKLNRPILIANAVLFATAILSSAAILSLTSPAQAQSKGDRFVCGSTYNLAAKRKVPTTILWTTTGRTVIVQWVKPFDNYWTPTRRCEVFSGKINKAYQDGTLAKFLTFDNKNGKKVICTATEVNGSCKNVLMTLRPQDKPLAFLTELKEVLYGRAKGPVEHSSGEPQIYIEIDWEAVFRNGAKIK